MLVEALRDRGVKATGIDISKWAIDQVPEKIRQFCTVASITDDFEGRYDLITCTEVLEHLPPSLAAESVANLCRHSDAILFSSTPDDFDEPTHLNVEPTGYWAQLFFREGFCAISTSTPVSSRVTLCCFDVAKSTSKNLSETTSRVCRISLGSSATVDALTEHAKTISSERIRWPGRSIACKTHWLTWSVAAPRRSWRHLKWSDSTRSVSVDWPRW